MFVVPSMNCTVPVAVEGVTCAVRFSVVPAAAGLGGETLRDVVVLWHQICVQVLPVIWMSARKYWGSAVPAPEVTIRIW